MAVARERDDDALDVELRTRLGQVLGRPEDGQLAEPVVAARAGRESTKPTTLTPYSGCSSSFRATSWPTSPAPTMTVFWR